MTVIEEIDIMEKEIKDKLLQLADDEYRQFASALLPNTKNILGVRLPYLRKLAREIARSDWRQYLSVNRNEYFEEIMLQGMVIGCIKADTEEILQYVAAYVPRIDNWSVCDSFCAGLKFTKSNKKAVWEFLQPYFGSNEEFDIRFAVVMLLNYFIEPDYIGSVLQILNNIRHEGYYVKMAVAWAVSICYIELPGETEVLLRNNSLDDFTFNKALQKIIESYRVGAENKLFIRSLKRK